MGQNSKATDQIGTQKLIITGTDHKKALRQCKIIYFLRHMPNGPLSKSDHCYSSPEFNTNCSLVGWLVWLTQYLMLMLMIMVILILWDLRLGCILQAQDTNLWMRVPIREVFRKKMEWMEIMSIKEGRRGGDGLWRLLENSILFFEYLPYREAVKNYLGTLS